MIELGENATSVDIVETLSGTSLVDAQTEVTIADDGTVTEIVDASVVFDVADATADVVVVADQDETVVLDAMAGPQGAAGPLGATGPIGPQGPMGPAGSATATYQHSQFSPSSTWNIAHSLGMYPAGVVVVDSAGTTVEGAEIDYVDLNNVILSWPSAFAGTAYLS